MGMPLLRKQGSGYHECGKARLNIILHIGHFHIADRPTGRKLLELGFKAQLTEGVDFLRYVDMIAVCNIVFIRTISLGYAGLCECTRYMTGKSHTDPVATPFALEVMQHLNVHQV